MMTNEEYQDKKNKDSIIPLLIIVLSITSCIVWYLILGHSINQDSIVVEVDLQKDRIPLSLYGVVVDENGETVKEHEVILENESRRIVTTKASGDLFFFDIGDGRHKLQLINNNEVTSSIEFDVVYSDLVSEYQYDKENNIFTISKDISLIELQFYVDGENLVIKEPISIVTNDSSWLRGQKEVYYPGYTILTAFNNIILQEGSIVIPHFGILLNDGRYLSGEGIIYDQAGYINLLDFNITNTTIKSESKYHFILENDVIVKFIDGRLHVYTTDGTETIFYLYSILEDGTIIKPNGEVIDNNGNKHQNIDGLVVGLDNIMPPKDVEVVVGTSYQWNDLTVYDDETRWSTSTNINLFGSNAIIAPGDFGQYSFTIKNSSDYNVEYVMNIQEQTMMDNGGNLPLLYRLRDEGTYYGSGDYVDVNTLEKYIVTLPKKSSNKYILEWYWPFEGDDEYDIQLATAKNLTHIIRITIHAKSR